MQNSTAISFNQRNDFQTRVIRPWTNDLPFRYAAATKNTKQWPHRYRWQDQAFPKNTFIQSPSVLQRENCVSNWTFRFFRKVHLVTIHVTIQFHLISSVCCPCFSSLTMLMLDFCHGCRVFQGTTWRHRRPCPNSCHRWPPPLWPMPPGWPLRPRDEAAPEMRWTPGCGSTMGDLVPDSDSASLLFIKK